MFSRLWTTRLERQARPGQPRFLLSSCAKFIYSYDFAGAFSPNLFNHLRSHMLYEGSQPTNLLLDLKRPTVDPRRTDPCSELQLALRR